MGLKKTFLLLLMGIPASGYSFTAKSAMEVAFSYKSHPSERQKSAIIRYLVDGDPRYPLERINKAHRVMSDYCGERRPELTKKEFHSKEIYSSSNGATVLYLYLHFKCADKI
jgi:hypothetical protein